MSSPRTVILSVVAIALICSVFSVIDAKVCGGDADCLSNNADGTCVSGTCKYLCHSNYKDCDHNMDNGCECDIMVDETNCGGCGRFCPSPYNAKASCEAGKCVITDSDEDFFIPGQY
ncbi:hypothetical protein M758_9G093000 [Ceratodon purpureus]|uniref:Uncharacterized protein n=1 Tax=Ceratodon purpureus TaxID=3225 RepID=A0A8T0GUS5_CERPU|nr:hypothetical protein KC19_9G163200 [Ceratodon purpureus]KAG0605850.1 hypothetical protein M758_9G093000 [Ceratodon purpureus]